MDSLGILVVGSSPECAEEINSLLRNHGILVRVSFAADCRGVRDRLQAERADLLIYDVSAPVEAPVDEVMALGEAASAMNCVRFSPAAPERLIEAAAGHRCITLNADDNQQLLGLVETLLREWQAAKRARPMQDPLRDLQQCYDTLLDSTADAVALVHEGLHIRANRVYLDLMRAANLDELAAVSVLERVEASSDRLRTVLSKLQSNGGECDLAVTVSTPGHDAFEADLACRGVRFGGEQCVHLVLRPRDEHARLQTEMKRLRETDPLTQLPNRHAFEQRLAESPGPAPDGYEAAALYYLEPDGMAELARQLDPPASDELLAALAARLHAAVGDDDLLARYSDHGFVVFAQRKDSGSLQRLGDALLRAGANPAPDSGTEQTTAGISIGMAWANGEVSAWEAWLRQARSAFNTAARAGATLERYRPEQAAAAGDAPDGHWADRIRQALDNREFYSVQHSIINLEGETEGLFENRTQMRAQGGDLPPEEYLPAAEFHGLGSNIDRHIIPGLLGAISGSGDRHIINLSRNSAQDFSFTAWLSQQLEQHAVIPSQLIFQIATPAAIDHREETQRLRQELAALGCGFAMAEYGDQPGSYRLLETMRPALVKLKADLTRDLPDRPDHQDLVRRLTARARALHTEVIADDIQDASALAMLWQCGIRWVAGEFLEDMPQLENIRSGPG